jgi:hypothetical protein
VTDQLDGKQLRGDSYMIKKRLVQFANKADIEIPGALDDLSCHMKRMPDPLKEIKKKRIGSHRVYYTGAYQNCRYDVVFIKPFKKSGTDDDDDKVFQQRLANLLANTGGQNKALELPKA